MEPFLSVEERMKLIVSVIKHAKITFADAYKLSNLELETLNRLLTVREVRPIQHRSEDWFETTDRWGDIEEDNDYENGLIDPMMVGREEFPF